MNYPNNIIELLIQYLNVPQCHLKNAKTFTDYVKFILPKMTLSKTYNLIKVNRGFDFVLFDSFRLIASYSISYQDLQIMFNRYKNNSKYEQLQFQF